MLLRDTDERARGRPRRADASHRVAERYGVVSSELRAEGEHPLERLASLVAVLDFASVYLALLQGIDPTPDRADRRAEGDGSRERCAR